MLLFPAIDLRGGRCVRLRQGDYSQETIFGDDPSLVARRWVDLGAAFLHLVDLDGAKEGRPVNGESIRAIVAAAPVPCQLGGGLRSEEHIREALSWGVERVILGSRAAKDPAWLERVSRAFPAQVVLGIDARDGQVATEGWLETTGKSALDLARHCQTWPLAGIVYTDISRDGMLAGPNLTALSEIVNAVKLPVIASGGVTTLHDVRAVREAGAAGCIIGRALYEGKLDLTAALLVAGGEGS